MQVLNQKSEAWGGGWHPHDQSLEVRSLHECNGGMEALHSACVVGNYSRPRWLSGRVNSMQFLRFKPWAPFSFQLVPCTQKADQPISALSCPSDPPLDYF